MRRTAIALLFAAACCAQTRPEWVHDHAENLDFAAGDPGQMPPGWSLGGDASYEARIVTDASCNGSKQCGNVRSLGLGPHSRCFLYQNVDATPSRLKWISFRAAVRLTGAGSARLLVRVHRGDNSTSFFDNMGDHPVTAGPWAFYQIDAPVVAEARDVEFGIQLYGEGSATIDNVSLTLGELPRRSDEIAIRALMKKFAEARNGHDGAGVAALYSEDGEWSTAEGGGLAHGRQALTILWNGVTGQVERSVDSVEFETPTIAIVHGTARYTQPDHVSHEIFVLIKQAGNWFIRIHQMLD